MPLSRSENMARIRGQDTGPERVLHDALVAAGIAVQAHLQTPFGRPDLAVIGTMIALFIDGCFWHGCPEHYSRPGAREAFWAQRLRETVERDRRQTLGLEQAGWIVLRVWEHSVHVELEAVVARVAAAMRAAPGGLGERGPSWRVVRVDVVDPVARVERRWMVDLRDPERQAVVEGRRVTGKWRRGRG